MTAFDGRLIKEGDEVTIRKTMKALPEGYFYGHPRTLDLLLREGWEIVSVATPSGSLPGGES